ncbi:MAG: hypothetical protein V4653_15270 [Pseudomonadota bacterium]
MKRVGGPSVPVVGAGAIRPGPPPGPPRPARPGPSPWSVPGPAARPGGLRHSRWPGFLLLLLGAGGFALVVAAMRDGPGMAWSKSVFIDITAWVAARPAWAPEVAADLAVLTRPTLLCVVGGAAVLGAWARAGFGAGLRLFLLFGVARAVLIAFAVAFATPVEGMPDWQALARFPSAPVFWAVLAWGWLFTVLGGRLMPAVGVLVAAAAAAGRVAVGDDAPVDAIAGGLAALAFWGAVSWVAPGRR